jgi:hypothetical protein
MQIGFAYIPEGKGVGDEGGRGLQASSAEASSIALMSSVEVSAGADEILLDGDLVMKAQDTIRSLFIVHFLPIPSVSSPRHVNH